MKQKFKFISMFLILILLFQTGTFSTFSLPDGIDRAAWKSLYDIAYNGSNKYVAIGKNGLIKISSNGTEWKSVVSPAKKNLARVIWNGKIFLAAGYGMMIVSSNGVDWTAGNNISSYNIRSLSWNGKTFVAVGESNTILVSSDGLNWEKVISPVSFSMVWQDITWDGNNFSAVGNNGRIIFSPDGRKWTSVSPGCEEDLYAIIWTGKQYVAAGNDILITSKDGISWVEPKSPDDYNLFWNLATNGSIIVASSDFGNIRTSSDGKKWNDYWISNNAGGIGRMIWDGKRFIGTEESGNVIMSVNGSDWSMISTSASPSPTATSTIKPTSTYTSKPATTPTLKTSPTCTFKPTVTPTLKTSPTYTTKTTVTPTPKTSPTYTSKPTVTPTPKTSPTYTTKTTVTPTPKTSPTYTSKPTVTPTRTPKYISIRSICNGSFGYILKVKKGSIFTVWAKSTAGSIG